MGFHSHSFLRIIPSSSPFAILFFPACFFCLGFFLGTCFGAACQPFFADPARTPHAPLLASLCFAVASLSPSSVITRYCRLHSTRFPPRPLLPARRTPQRRPAAPPGRSPS